jgi:hypothetical protein
MEDFLFLMRGIVTPFKSVKCHHVIMSVENVFVVCLLLRTHM